MQLGKRLVAELMKILKNRIRGVWLIVSLLFVFALCSQAFANSVSYTYDSLNRLTSIIYGNGDTLSYTYDAAGNRLSYTSTNAPIFLIPGDLNNDGGVDLADAIIAFKVIIRMKSTGLRADYTTTTQIDVNGNNRVGIEELIYILQKTARMR
jgi:YD repeat-containing protein